MSVGCMRPPLLPWDQRLGIPEHRLGQRRAERSLPVPQTDCRQMWAHTAGQWLAGHYRAGTRGCQVLGFITWALT